MFFCILFNYTILRDTKDVLMVTAPGSGAEVIPFIKTYVNLPTAIVSTNFWLIFVVLDYSSAGRINLALIFFLSLSSSIDIYFLGVYWTICLDVRQDGTKECLLCLCVPFLGILFYVCPCSVPQPSLIAPSCHGGHVGHPLAAWILGSLGHDSKLEFRHILCYGRNVGKCCDIPPVLGLCQWSNHSRRGQKVL